MAKKRKSRRRGLQYHAEAFALDLLFQASDGKIGRAKGVASEKENSISFRDRRALLDSITKLLGAQDAPDDEEEDGIAEFRERLNESSGAPERGTGSDTDEV